MKEIIRTTITALIVILVALVRPDQCGGTRCRPRPATRDGGLRVGVNRVGQIIYQLFIFVALSSLIWAPHDLPAHDLRPEDIVTIFPKDAIPAILSPSFEEGSVVSWLKGKEAVIGIEINGDSRAYPVSILRRVEIINDRVGGIPIAVSW